MFARLTAARRLVEARRQKHAAIDAQDSHRAAMWRDVERRLQLGRKVDWPPPISGVRRRRWSATAVPALPAGLLAGAFLVGLGLLIAWATWG